MTPAASPRTPRPIPPFTLTPTDEEMLEACARYQYITALGGRGKGRSIFTHGTRGRKFAQSLGTCVQRGALLPGRSPTSTMHGRSGRGPIFIRAVPSRGVWRGKGASRTSL